MRSLLVSMALAVAAAACAPAWASPAGDAAQGPAMRLPLEGATVITNPDWLKRPTGEEMANYYPPVASTLSIDGHATIECEVLTSGLVDGCTIRAEKPAGMGFGDAAVAMAKYFQMKPMTVDGAPVSGGKVIIPIGFLVPSNIDGPEAAAPPGPPPSARALQLARRIATVVFGPEQTEATVDGLRRQFSQRFADLSLTEAEQAAIDDYLDAARDGLARRVDAAAPVYAGYYSEAQLADIAAFFESPAGRAWVAQPSAMNSALLAATVQVWNAIRQDGAARFCAKYDCGAPPAAAAPSR